MGCCEIKDRAERDALHVELMRQGWSFYFEGRTWTAMHFEDDTRLHAETYGAAIMLAKKEQEKRDETNTSRQ